MDRVRLAIVGCGNICQLNAPGYLEHPRCDVVALCDTDPARAERRAHDWSIAPKIYADYAQVLDDPAVDAVESSRRPTCTPTRSWPGSPRASTSRVRSRSP